MTSLADDAWIEPAVDPDLVGLRVALEKRLGREDHLDLARPDPEGERPERPVCRGVRVAADDRHPRLRQPELRSDDMDDALVGDPRPWSGIENSAQLRVSWSTWAAAIGSATWAGCGSESGSSGPPLQRSAQGDGRESPRARSPKNACGEVTSWTR